MADSCRETVEQLRADKKNRTYAELKAILESAGFVMHSRQKGSHRTFQKPGCLIAPTLVDQRGPVKAYSVRIVIQALEECCDD
jgi:HicA toxin of bacterial toxin-antitoxin,